MNQASAVVAKQLIQMIRLNLENALKIAKAAECCAGQGNIDQAIKVMMDYEDPAFQARAAYDAALQECLH